MKKALRQVLEDPPSSMVLVSDTTQMRMEVTICACGVLVARPMFAEHGRRCKVLKERFS